jgi:hypothetical protein
MTNMNICHGQCWYNQMILVDPRDPNRNTVWIGGDLATAQSTNGGTSWSVKTWWLYSQFATLPYAHADHHAAAFKTTGTPTIILGNDGGLNISVDDGASFSSDKNNGLVSHLYYTVAGNAQLPNLVIGGTQDNGTRLRTDNGTTHNQVIGGDGTGAAHSQANTNALLGSSQGSGIRMSLNSDPTAYQHWVSRGTLSDSAGAPFLTSIVAPAANLDSTGKIFYHFTASRVWRTNDAGLTFILIGSATAPTSPGLPSTRRFRSSPYNLGVSPYDLNRIAVGAGGGFIDVTTNGGATWTDIDVVTKMPGYLGFVTNVTWQDNQNLWITSVAQAPGAIRVVKATIATPGSPWSTATYAAKQNGLPDLPVTRVYFDPRDGSRNTIYAATHVGLYRTVDGGDNWEPYGNGLPTVRVNDIYMPPDGSFIRIATYGRGIWELAQLELVSAELSDGASSCDNDGILDEGETGLLTVTLKNQGPNNVNQVTLTLTSANPHVTLPEGNVLAFPPVQKNGVSTGSIRVGLSGASGIETAEIALAIAAPELAVPPFNVASTYRVNYDEQPEGSATETVDGSVSGWTTFGSATALPNVEAWARRALTPTRSVWWGPDNNGQVDDTKPSLPDQQILVSPAMQVGTDPLIISFLHRFSFESGGWDGGVIEISTNGGASWTDIGVGSYNGSTNAVTSAPIGASRPAFVNRMTGWPNFATVTRNLGLTYANQNILIRFRVGADESAGAPGWEIDEVTVTGITNTPFTKLVGETGACTP